LTSLRWRFGRNLFEQDLSGWREPQVAPLRYAPVGMTNLRAALSCDICQRWREKQVPPLRYAPVKMTILLL
jgi:hypothetical protein